MNATNFKTDIFMSHSGELVRRAFEFGSYIGGAVKRYKGEWEARPNYPHGPILSTHTSGLDAVKALRANARKAAV